MKPNRITLTTLTALAPLTSLLLLPACGTQDDTTDPETQGAVAEMRAALPTAEHMTIRVPTQAALTGEQATFYGFTRGVSVHVNGTVHFITDLIRDVVETPPADTDDATYALWGPYRDALSPASWVVRVDRQPDGSFRYSVQGFDRNGDPAAATTVLEGGHTPGDGAGRGFGYWRYDVTAGHALDPTTQSSTGVMEVQYDLAGDRTLEVKFTDFQAENDPVPNDALYRYTEAADGSGTFDFVSNLDIDEDSDPTRDRRELMQVRSRWLPDGPGRSDVVATHGDLAADVQVDLTECWDAAFTRTYVRFAFPGAEQTDGDAADCPFPTPEYPRFDDFDPAAFADADLVAALPEPADLDFAPVGIADPVAEPAAYYVVTVDTVRDTNAHVRETLDGLRQITRLPPNDCTPQGCTWGPYTDWARGVTSRVEVLRAGDGLFTFNAVGKRFGEADDAWVRLYEGGFSSTDENGDGDGWYALDLTAIGAWQQTPGSGRVRVELSRRGAGGTILLRGDDIVPEGGAGPFSVRYALQVEPDGSGKVSFALPGDVDDGRDGRTALESVSAVTRWVPGGVGQTNVRVSAGDLGDDEIVLGLQCWDDRAALTHEAYAKQAPDAAARPEADPEACPFADWAEPEFPPLADE